MVRKLASYLRRWGLAASLLLVVILSDLLLVGTPVAAQEGDAAGGAAIAVENDRADDAQIARRIRGILSEIDGLQRLRVSVASGVVTLSGEVQDTAQIDAAEGFAARVEGVVSVNNEVQLADSVVAQLDPAIERLQARYDSIIVLAPLVLIALLVFALVVGLGLLVTRNVSFWQRLAPNKFIADVYRMVARLAFFIIGVVVALDVLNATALIGAVLGAAGVAGLAVGFAVRDTVENFIASVLLSLRQPFRPNDFVEIEGMMGNVARLTSRATVLISPDGNHIRIPNSTVFKGVIINYTRQPSRRFTFQLGVDADSDLGRALTTAVDAMDAQDFILSDPPLSAWIDEVGDSNVLLTFAGWIDQTHVDFLKGRGEAIRAAKTALEEAGFGLPEPIYRLKFDGQTGLPVGSDNLASLTEQDAPPAPGPQSAPPSAANPENRDLAPQEAAAQEAVAGDTSENLLSDERRTE